MRVRSRRHGEWIKAGAQVYRVPERTVQNWRQRNDPRWHELEELISLHLITVRPAYLYRSQICRQQTTAFFDEQRQVVHWQHCFNKWYLEAYDNDCFCEKKRFGRIHAALIKACAKVHRVSAEAVRRWRKRNDARWSQFVVSNPAVATLPRIVRRKTISNEAKNAFFNEQWSLVYWDRTFNNWYFENAKQVVKKGELNTRRFERSSTKAIAKKQLDAWRKEHDAINVFERDYDRAYYRCIRQEIIKDANRLYRLRNRNAINAAKRIRYCNNNAAERARRKHIYDQNREKMLEQRRRWAAANKNKVLRAAREYKRRRYPNKMQLKTQKTIHAITAIH